MGGEVHRGEEGQVVWSAVSMGSGAPARRGGGGFGEGGRTRARGGPAGSLPARVRLPVGWRASGVAAADVRTPLARCRRGRLPAIGNAAGHTPRPAVGVPFPSPPPPRPHPQLGRRTPRQQGLWG